MSPGEAARRVRLLALDVDGVLTDNAVYVGLVDGQRVELKRFDIQDGLGLGLLCWIAVWPALAFLIGGTVVAVKHADTRTGSGGAA